MKRLLYLLALLVAFGGTAKANAASASGGCDPFGCSEIGPITPWSGLAIWNQDHLPVAGCRWLTDFSRGLYPVAVKPALAFPLPVKWITSYTFHARITWCWSADGWNQNQYGDIDWTSVTHPHITKFNVQVWWGDFSDVTSNEHVIQTQARYHPCAIGIQPSVARGCLTVKIVGGITVNVPPPLRLGVLNPHPRVTFTNLGADGSYTGSSHDTTPF